MRSVLVPPRRRGMEFLEEPGVDPELVRRSLADVSRANLLFGGTRAVLREIDAVLRSGHGQRDFSLLDVGTGAGDIPARAGRVARARGMRLTTFGLDESETLALASRGLLTATIRGDALTLPCGTRSVDIVTCSQVLHHFPDDRARQVIRELDRVARVRVIISDLRRSWLAAAGIWLASFPLGFHPVSRHDGVVSVMRGYTAGELSRLVTSAVRCVPSVRRRLGYRVTASWIPEEG